jgi:gamma-glutamyltranspeptidase/glutathione hydrolase/leukotriene-C4 hydrolase
MFKPWGPNSKGRWKRCGLCCRHYFLSWRREYVLVSTLVTPRCAALTVFHRSGIGGGGFMTVRLPPSAPGGTSEVWAIDFRETAPALAKSTMYVGRPLEAQFGGLSVGVPGEVRGLAEAHKRWGKLPWRRLVQPSADIAAGWTVSKELGLRIHVSTDLVYNLVKLIE